MKTRLTARSLAAALTLLTVVAVPRTAPAAEVAVLKSSEVPAWRPALDALRRVAAGHSVTEYDLRNDRTTADRVLATLVGKDLVVVALGPLAAQLARLHLPEAALVFGMVQDPEKLGLAPGPGVTGVTFRVPVKNQIAAFRLVNPRGARIGVLYSPAAAELVAEAEASAGLLRVIVVSRPVSAEREIPGTLRELLSGDTIDALWVPADPLLLTEGTRRFLLSETAKKGKPVYTFTPTLVEEGALVSNGPDYVSIGEQLGELVNRLAGGERSRIELLVPRAELVINKRIADRLDIEVPAEALESAGKVF